MKLSAIRPIALVLSRELMITVLRLRGVSCVVFVILFASPGDPFSVLLEGQLSTAEAKAGVREAMGVPRSWYIQYLTWLANMLSGNLGTSIRMGFPVLPQGLRVGLSTLILTIGSLIITLLIAVPIALYSAVRGTDKISWPLTMFSYIISALPIFWLRYVVIYFFTPKPGLFPLPFGS